MEGLRERGIADVLAIAFMFILLVLGTVTIHALSLRPLQAASSRQLELKSQHLYKALELAQVYPYTLSFLEASAQVLILEDPVVPENYLRPQMLEALEYLRPLGYGVWVKVSHENLSLEFFSPSPPRGKRFIQRGKVSVFGAGGENLVVGVELVLFELD